MYQGKWLINIFIYFIIRFDGIKYEVKKIEEVVYDITLRGLYPIRK
jgi:hypothetical protein